MSYSAFAEGSALFGWRLWAPLPGGWRRWNRLLIRNHRESPRNCGGTVPEPVLLDRFGLSYGRAVWFSTGKNAGTHVPASALSGFKLRVASHVPRLVGRSRFDSSTLILNADATLGDMIWGNALNGFQQMLLLDQCRCFFSIRNRS